MLRSPVRTLRCRNDCCPRRMFSERFPEDVRHYVRLRACTALRVGDQMRTLGHLLGGRGTELLTPLLRIPVTNQTVVRHRTSGPRRRQPSAHRQSRSWECQGPVERHINLVFGVHTHPASFSSSCRLLSSTENTAWL